MANKIPPKIVYNGNEYIYHLLPAPGAAAHNAKYRGQSLGAFNNTYAANLANGSFDGMYIGDYFTQNGHKYKIAGFEYLFGKDHNTSLGHHALMITDVLDNYDMNTSNTTSGGFVNSDMWRNYFPTVTSQLKSDFGSHLLTWNEYLTNDTDGNAANSGQWVSTQVSMMNTYMYWGSGQYSTPSGSKNYNLGIETTQLPIMKLHPDEQKNGGTWTWQRDVYNSQAFADADNDGSQGWNYASNTNGVRAFFLIG